MMMMMMMMAPGANRIALNTQADGAYAKLKRALLYGKLRAGRIYTEKELVRVTKGGRTPTREGILRLAHEGLLTVVPRRGIFVPAPSIREIHDVFEMRLILEPEFMRLAFDRVTPDEVAQWIRLLQGCLKRSPVISAARKITLDRRVHEFFARKTVNSAALPALEVLLDRDVTQFMLSTEIENRYPKVWGEHLQIFRAIQRRDLRGAQDAMRHHLRASLDDLTRFIDRMLRHEPHSRPA